MEKKRTPAKSFEELIVWQKAHQFVLAIYKITDGFPQREQFGLTSQLRRAAISIPANIAEGFKKNGRLDKTRFLNISQGSVEECRYYLMLVRDLSYAEISTIMELLEEVSKLLYAYRKSILTSVS